MVVLKSQWYGSGESGVPLPYRIDLLRRAGIELRWTDRDRTARWRTHARRTEVIVPWVQAVLTRHDRRGAAATIAMFESEGHGLALWRRVTGRRRPPLIIIGCWLADLARAGGWRRRLYRWLYGAVDQVVVFSANQVATLSELLGIPPERIEVVHFGVDLEELAGVEVIDRGTVVAVGRDLGRDWPTFLAAVEGTGWNVVLLSRLQQMEGLSVPEEVSFPGTVDRAGYLDVLATAAVVVVPTHVREYPTGQTVLLEAMALGKACVVTDTPAMHTYVDDGVTASLVPPADPLALRAAITALVDDRSARDRLGAAARANARSGGGAAAMWARIAELVPEDRA